MTSAAKLSACLVSLERQLRALEDEPLIGEQALSADRAKLQELDEAIAVARCRQTYLLKRNEKLQARVERRRAEGLVPPVGPNANKAAVELQELMAETLEEALQSPTCTYSDEKQEGAGIGTDAEGPEAEESEAVESEAEQSEAVESEAEESEAVESEEEESEAVESEEEESEAVESEEESEAVESEEEESEVEPDTGAKAKDSKRPATSFQINNSGLAKKNAEAGPTNAEAGPSNGSASGAKAAAPRQSRKLVPPSPLRELPPRTTAVQAKAPAAPAPSHKPQPEHQLAATALGLPPSTFVLYNNHATFPRPLLKLLDMYPTDVQEMMSFSSTNVKAYLQLVLLPRDGATFYVTAVGSAICVFFGPQRRGMLLFDPLEAAAVCMEQASKLMRSCNGNESEAKPVDMVRALFGKHTSQLKVVSSVTDGVLSNVCTVDVPQ